MARLNVHDIRELALQIVTQHPGGIRRTEIVEQIMSDNPETNLNTTRTQVAELATHFPDQVVKPSRGLFKPASAEKGVEEPPVAPAKFKEEDFYEAFAAYLRDDLDEVTTVSALGGNAIRGRWGTPDVVGVYKPLASNLIKFQPEIVSAELKTDPQAPVVAFGQATAYRLFSAKCYVVVPRTVSEEDLARLQALCMLFGMGLVVFDVDPKTPNFEPLLRAQKFSPDMFYVNEFARRLHQHDATLYEKLFS